MADSPVRFRTLLQLAEPPLLDEPSQHAFTRCPVDKYAFVAHNLADGTSRPGKCLAPFLDIRIMRLSASGTRLAYLVKTAVGLAVFSRDSNFVLRDPFVCKLRHAHHQSLDFHWIGDHSIVALHRDEIELHSIRGRGTWLVDKIKGPILSWDILPARHLLCYISALRRVYVARLSPSCVLHVMCFNNVASPEVGLLDLYGTVYLAFLSRRASLYRVQWNDANPRPVFEFDWAQHSLATSDNLLVLLLPDRLFILDCPHSPDPLPLLPHALTHFSPSHHSDLILTPSALLRLEVHPRIFRLLPSELSRCSFLLRRSDNWKVLLDYFKEIINYDDISLLNDLFRLIYTRPESAEYTWEDLLNVMMSSFRDLPHHLFLLHTRWTRSHDPPVLLIKSLIQQNKLSTVAQYIGLLPESVPLSQVLIESPVFLIEGVEMLTKFTSHGPYDVYRQLLSNLFDFGLLSKFVENRGKPFVRIAGVECPITPHFRAFLDIIRSH